MDYRKCRSTPSPWIPSPQHTHTNEHTHTPRQRLQSHSQTQGTAASRRADTAHRQPASHRHDVRQRGAHASINQGSPSLNEPHPSILPSLLASRGCAEETRGGAAGGSEGKGGGGGWAASASSPQLARRGPFVSIPSGRQAGSPRTGIPAKPNPGYDSVLP